MDKKSQARSQDTVDEYFKDESDEGKVVETAHLEGEFHKFVTTKGGTEARYPLGNFFIGRWGNTPCVIRSYVVDESDKCSDDAKFKLRELAALKLNGSIHENFIRYLGEFTSSDLNKTHRRYYAIELCRFSVAALFEGHKARENLKTVINGGLSLIELLRQTTAGLDYLHSYGFIHRNIHPRNVLIAEIGGDKNKKKRYMVKLSDFRGGKKLESDGTVDNSRTQGETSWIAPEMADSRALLTTAVDVFILGCFFHYVLSGKHPFGSKPPEWKKNIEDCNYQPKIAIPLPAADSDGPKMERLIDLIKKMLRRQPEQRPDLNQVLEYFQTWEYFPIYDGIKERIRPGLCVIINQQIFHETEHNRKGSDVDVKALSETFLTFGYDLRLYANLTKDQLIQTVDEIATKGMLLKDYASLVVCLLSHGGLGTIEGVDGQAANVISDIQWAFNSQKCPELINKPKIFIIQACQGNYGQRMIPASSSSSPEREKIKSLTTPLKAPELEMAKAYGDEDDQPEDYSQGIKIKAQFVDVVTLWSTIEGFVSLRNRVDGSLFIQNLCRHLKAGRSSSLNGGGEWIDLYQAHLDATYNISSDATQVVIKKRLFWMNQTPLYKSSACQKIGFRKVSSSSTGDAGHEQTVYNCIPKQDSIYMTIINHIDNLKKQNKEFKFTIIEESHGGFTRASGASAAKRKRGVDVPVPIFPKKP